MATAQNDDGSKTTGLHKDTSPLFEAAYELPDEILAKYILDVLDDELQDNTIEQLENENSFFKDRINGLRYLIQDKEIYTFKEYNNILGTLRDEELIKFKIRIAGGDALAPTGIILDNEVSKYFSGMPDMKGMEPADSQAKQVFQDRLYEKLKAATLAGNNPNIKTLGSQEAALAQLDQVFGKSETSVVIAKDDKSYGQ